MIIDTNVIVSMVIEPSHVKNKFAKNNYLCAPTLLPLELINVFRKYHFLKGIDIGIVNQYYSYSIDLLDDLYHLAPLLPMAKNISFALNHPVYDCVFLALAKTKKLPFVSMDKRLLAKANDYNIDTVDFDQI